MSFRVINDQALRFSGERIDQAAYAALARITQEAAKMLKEGIRTEPDSRGFVGRNDTGLTGQAIFASTPTRTGSGIEATVSVSPQQLTPALVIELGRRPGKSVSEEGRRRLAVWARRKAKALVASLAAEIRKRRAGAKRVAGRASPTEEAERQAAFLIARAIKRRGIPATHLFSRVRAIMRQRAPQIVAEVFAKIQRGG